MNTITVGTPTGQDLEKALKVAGLSDQAITMA